MTPSTTSSLSTMPRRSNRRAWWLMIVFFLLIFVVTGGIWGYNLKKLIDGFKAMGVPKQTVSTAVLEPQSWRDSYEVIGSVVATRGADLSLEVPGVVEAINFESGKDVTAGTELLRLSDDNERVQLETARTALALAQTNFERDRKQLAANLISQAQFDATQNTLKSAQLAVRQQEVALAKRRLVAPFAGRLGLRAVDVGQYVQPGTKLVSLIALDRVHVDFSMPQTMMGSVQSGMPVVLRSDDAPNEKISGYISAVDAKVDNDTRNITLRGIFNNPGKRLLPGMFVRGTLEIGQNRDYLTLPQTAVTYNPYGESLFVVMKRADYDREQQAAASGASVPPAPTLPEIAASQAGVPVIKSVLFKMGSLTLVTVGSTTVETPKPVEQKPGEGEQLVVKQVFVKVGPKRGDQVAILSGVKPGDQVVTSGQLKLKNGSPIVVNNTVLPTNEPNPKTNEQ